MNLSERARLIVVQVLFALVFIAITVSSYTQKSATWDEPQHLTAGYTALALDDYRIDPEHPPFLRQWAALPLLFMRDVDAGTNGLPWKTGDQWNFCHEFMYQKNDADRLLYAGRFMIVILGIALGILVFHWTRELFGFWPALATLCLFCVEPNILAHSSVVTTDMGVTCFFFATLYFLWRLTREFTVGNVVGMTLFFSLAQVSKYSALLLGPVVIVLLLLQIGKSHGRCFLKIVGVAALLITASYFSFWAVYGFRHSPAAASLDEVGFQTNPVAREKMPRLTAAVDWIDQHRLLPNTCVRGFLLGQAKAQKRSSFLAGEFSNEGWWYYFPVAFLLKTPITLLLLIFGGCVLGALRLRAHWRNALFLLLPIAVYGGAAVAAKLNIGLRHILPIYPFLFPVAGGCLAALINSKRKRLASVAVLAGVVEFATIYPDHLAFFNAAVGGATNGHKYLVDSNIDWGQDLKGLKQWMVKNNVENINLSYFGTADPAYYRINCVHLPGAPFFAWSVVQGPRLPGYVAVSVTNLRAVYENDAVKALYKPLLAREPDAVIGRSIHVYWIEQPWW